MEVKNVLITGSSSGFGYELAKLFRENEYNVIGVSRSISDLDITNIQCDLNDLESVKDLYLPDLDYEYIILNAGVLGKIDNLCNITVDEFKYVFNVNFHSNKILLDKLMKKSPNNVIGISSGAAHKTYLGWSQYCSSKSAFKQLISSYSDEYLETKFISLAPGIMKSKMQDEIYKVDETKFPSVKKFKSLYDGDMETPLDLANKFMKNLDTITHRESGSFFDMREIKEENTIKAFVFDIDGVLTDGSIIVTEDDQLRTFNVKDGYALINAIRKGYKVGIISGGKSLSVVQRLTSLGVDPNLIYIKVPTLDKIKILNELIEKASVTMDEVAYMGDDIPDLSVLNTVGLPASPSDACDEVIECSSFISSKKGGKGCVRDLIQTVMIKNGDWL
ncbi:MAG: 3-deoxy-D-manno-octulosonate 8-phosphate phosphatase KdsC [uncultured marine phage]|uniref:3-deoxy-D-manno-octulosonate 8-phosphate phosphatase KdsC n=1 Tax=uncultured marine phage TaxID=707152 RepID=A0A8D9C9P5_9VIRU|nr:MAG: 3-deoxy-D-manno-octulosonate 8-phosphate phosphatase KdsC [uncultured marine phage]